MGHQRAGKEHGVFLVARKINVNVHFDGTGQICDDSFPAFQLFCGKVEFLPPKNITIFGKDFFRNYPLPIILSCHP